MADNSLKNPVEIQATRIDATLLPSNFSQPYFLYVVQQGADLGNVANKANQAGDGAYDAQVKNDEQDVVLADHEKQLTDHEKRITSAEEKLVNHEQRLTTAESNIASQSQRITAVESDVKTIKSDYISKSATTVQKLASPLDVATSYSVNGVQVIGTRVTGFTAATGMALKDSFNADANQAISQTYTPAEIQALVSLVVSSRQRIKALEDALRAHGLID
ncbi:hemolysin XhlA family protein [Xenorhabdus bovienii]|uniref:phage tail protein n=1 Tax=Xenorhabdus bovienii TaxID=40576 RepID=UPI0023B20B71|nr:phage tail protein [Xenorhabdus bovienii]MDE9483044.1 hemolysin XhlA family protein [Xenorhabdus bovienii]MDE9557519.1 hemolysin XhlA family protein [Xenorhabdus bovienii]